MGRSLAPAVMTLRRGGLVAYPTESVFGLGCLPNNARAVRRLLRLKRRAQSKGLILIAANIKQLLPYVGEISAAARATWPGPYTWLVPARPRAPRWLRGRHDTVAVRVTAHPLARALCLRANSALVSTSANLAGTVPARNARDVARRFGARVDDVVRGRVGGQRQPTQIADARTGRVMRASVPRR